MEGMIVKTFRLTAPQVAALEAEAAELGINSAELLRRILDERRFGKAKATTKATTGGCDGGVYGGV